MEWYLILAVIAAGIICGFINTIAGSGSLISLPLLMSLGLPANVANGTNRIAILLQSAVGIVSFHKKKQLDLKKGLGLSISAVVGSVAGAFIAAEINEDLMEKAVGIVLLFMLVMIIVKPDKWTRQSVGFPEGKISVLQIVIFFLIGVYGGFIQAGVGVFLLTALVLGVGYDLVKANAIKLLITFLFTPFALGIFIWYGQVNWAWGLILAVGNMTGAYLATKFAVSWGPKYIRWVLIFVIIAASTKLLGLWDVIYDIFT
ncbi:MAG: sulfite exporter TauE/SafE family protein [Bacteroidetes bacterium]|nr:sulfite exporter TauE/SafE family protein [Bacteroidota bacterium]MBU1720664.1 sulfite exporter TauE/SafE family protein [Bacteroidota bacterium]